MIELITGAPGAGKTTFTVAMRLLPESRRKIRQEDGTEVRRRIVAAGFRGMVIEHEKLPHKLTGETTATSEVLKWNATDPEREDAPKFERLPGDPPLDVPCIVENWWLWCMPGDLIPIDEAQFVAPRGTLGRKPPVWIQKLEVHRHYGVDFLIVTQHPQLIDTTIRALVGLHRHIRPVMGSPICMVYTWDYASNPERYTMANKGTFRRKAAHYKLFHSSVAHVKPPSSGRWALFVVPVLLGIFGVGFYGKVSGWISPANATPQLAASKAQAAPIVAGGKAPARAGAARTVQGCYSYGEQCGCIGEGGRPVAVTLELCQASAASFDGLVKWAPRKEQPPGAAKHGAAAGAASSPLGFKT